MVSINDICSVRTASRPKHSWRRRRNEGDSAAAIALVSVILPHWGPEGILARELAKLRLCSAAVDRAVRQVLPAMCRQRHWPWWPRPMAVEMPAGACCSSSSPRSRLSWLAFAHRYECNSSLWEMSGYCTQRRGDLVSMSYTSLSKAEDAWRLAAALWHDDGVRVLDLSFAGVTAVTLAVLSPAIATMTSLEHISLQGNAPIRDAAAAEALAGAVNTLPQLRTVLLPDGGSQLRRAFAARKKRFAVNFVNG